MTDIDETELADMRVKANLHENEHFADNEAKDDAEVQAKKKDKPRTYWDEVRARRKSQQVK